MKEWLAFLSERAITLIDAVGNVQGRGQLDDRDVLGRQGPAEHVAAGRGCRPSRLAVSATPKVRARHPKGSNTPVALSHQRCHPLLRQKASNVVLDASPVCHSSRVWPLPR